MFSHKITFLDLPQLLMAYYFNSAPQDLYPNTHTHTHSSFFSAHPIVKSMFFFSFVFRATGRESYRRCDL